MANSDSLRDQVVSGVIWKFAERIGAQVVTFVVSVVLARLLSPDDYGMIALVTIFITLANTFVDSGFGTALVQKKNADNIDFSTVFYFSIAVSIGLYLLLFFAAPAIGRFYDKPMLVPVLRVLALKLPLAGINTVQNAYVSRKMIFKKFFYATLGGTIASAVVGIAMAYWGYGIWALVAQYLTNSAIDTIVLWITVPWRPDLAFSAKRLKGLFSFGWKILCSSLIYNFYQELRSLVIGKVYTSVDLAYFTKGKQIPQLVVANINTSITSVMFPAIAKVQDDKEKVKQQVRRVVQVGSYLMWPAMLGLAAVSKPLIVLLLTEKWLPCVVFMQIACVQLALQPVQQANLQAIRAIGRSDLILKMEIIKRSLSIILVLLTMRISVLAIALAGVLDTILATLVNTAPNRKLLNYTYSEQIQDLTGPVLMSIVMAIPVYLVNFLPIANILKLLIQIPLGTAIYIGLSVCLKADSFYYALEILKPYLKKLQRSK